MANIEKSIDVEVPVRTAYNQWTQFEEFPSFMEGVTSVTQLDDRRLRWQANVGGKDKEWTSEITEQRPDERVAWKSTSGAKNAGVVTFHRLADRKTRVMLQLEYDPEGMVENVGDAVGLVTGAGEPRPHALQGLHRITPARDRRLARRSPRQGPVEGGSGLTFLHFRQARPCFAGSPTKCRNVRPDPETKRPALRAPRA